MTSGRKVYSRATLESLRTSKTNLSHFDIHIIANNLEHKIYDFKIKNFSIKGFHRIEGSDQISLVKKAFEVASQYEYSFFVEEDWLFSRDFDLEDLITYYYSGNFRQIVLSKFKFGFELEDAKKWGEVETYPLSKSVLGLNLKSYFTLNPMLVKKDVLIDLLTGFDWLNVQNWGANLERRFSEYLADRYGVSLVLIGRKEYRIYHLGLITGGHWIKTESQLSKIAISAKMKYHVIGISLKYWKR